jgi:hypothetical protein
MILSCQRAESTTNALSWVDGHRIPSRQTGSRVCYPFSKSGTHVDKVPIHVAGEAAESVMVRINIFTGGPAAWRFQRGRQARLLAAWVAAVLVVRRWRSRST